MDALYYEKLEDNKVKCLLCPRECIIKNGLPGHCLGRINRDGVLIAATYDHPASIAVDPIEKKPLYHFFPGENILSLGTYGCNLACSFCQNWSLSQQQVPTEELDAENAVRLASGRKTIGIAYTYNEPTVWYEYVLDCCKSIKNAGMKNVLVTNGYINEKPLHELIDYVDAMNIDLKAFTGEFYRDVCGGKIEPVKETIKFAAGKCHVELTNLVIPSYNNDSGEQDEMARWIRDNCGEDTPVHLSAYFPRYKLNAQATSAEDSYKSRDIFQKHLQYVYLGNVRTDEGNNTVCPSCGAVVIKRDGYDIGIEALSDAGDCSECGRELNIRR